MIWVCPLCQQPLQVSATGLVCDHKHQFDRAKEGYVNLLPAHHKNSRDPGDSKAMLQQRRAFLQQGFYQPLVELLARLLATQAGTAGFTLLDSGCGEGYYLAALRKQLNLPVAYGFDIAKDAVRLTAKLDRQLSCVVASSFAMPVADASVDALVRVFSPGAPAEVTRVLKTDGLLVVVSPGPAHMRELKALLLKRAEAHEPPAVEAGFDLLQEESLTFSNSLDTSALQQLLGMTPLFWRVSPERHGQLQAQQVLDVTADFIVRVYRKTQASEQVRDHCESGNCESGDCENGTDAHRD